MTTVPQPSTPVRLPKAVTTYSPITSDPDLRSQINTALLREGHVQKIADHLSHALSSSLTNWPTHIRNHALSLLRTGECTTFPVLFERVLADIKADTSLATEQREREEELGVAAGGGDGNGNGKGGRSAAEGSLAVPREVVEEGLRVTRECLELVCEVDT